ncbi:hypothetical protein VTK56DRAFT_2411 [Thermocarpiscus australiensis]
MRKTAVRRAGRAAVKKRIAELEAVVKPRLESKVGTAPQKITILPRPVRPTEPRLVVPQDEGTHKMERALQAKSPGELRQLEQSGGPVAPRTEDSSKKGIDDRGPYVLRRDAVGWHKDRPPNIAVISAIAFQQTRQRKKGPHAAVATVASAGSGTGSCVFPSANPSDTVGKIGQIYHSGL